MMLRRFFIWVVGGLTLVGTGTYAIVELYRWEWTRATIAALFFIALEIGLIGWLLGSRIAGLEHRLDEPVRRRESITRHLQAARQQPSGTFRWLTQTRDGMNVFVPLLLAAGVILSALAWVVERLSRMLAGRTADRRLAAQLSRLGPPAGGFLDSSDDPLRLLRGPVG